MIIKQFLLEKIKQMPIGKELSDVVFGKGGINYYLLLLSDKDIKNLVLEIKNDLKECNKNITNICIKNFEKKKEKLNNIIKDKGFFINDDIMDIFWDDINIK